MDGIRKKSNSSAFQKIEYTREEMPYFPLPKKRRALPLSAHTQKIPDFSCNYSLSKKPSVRKKKWRGFHFLLRFLAVCFFVFASCSAGAFGYFFWKAGETTQYMTGNTPSRSDFIHAATQLLPSFSHKKLQPLRGQEEGRINILLLGKASKEYPGQNLTDTIMIASVDTKTMRTALLSLPRDMQVQIPETKNFTKINTLYSIAKNDADPSNLIRKSVEEITGITIHYFIIADYHGFEQFIDAIEGIHVQVERDMYDARYPGPNYSYQVFELKKGFHTFDGETALKYVRERHSDPQGDFGRARRQQQVIESVKNKVFSLKTLLNPFALNGMLDALGDNIRTDILPNEIEGFIDIAKRADMQNINNIVVDAWKKDSLLRVSHVTLEDGQVMFALVPRAGNYSEIQDIAKNIFYEEERAARIKKIEQESASVAIFNYSNSPRVTSKVQNLLEDLGMRVFLFPADQKTVLRETTVIDETRLAKPYSLDEIIKKVPAKNASSKIPMVVSSLNQENNKDIDFTLLIGEDIVSQYNWKEASLEEYQKSENNDVPEQQ